ncbi:hypothetical protein VTL71DRAFT_6354 [Oculimacula yallundae]|uniref:CFEM domain-containing protein n=1 Tax=Oculimacula yallundae TaxID=86028 RepID=A0ABR4BWT6_9HELO
MKTFTALAVLAAGASATFFDASKFSCPSNTNNQCNPQQNSGFDWVNLNLGSFQNYGDFSFSGWECAGSFGSGRKRDVISGRTFQDKCITGKASHDKAKSPSFGCGSAPSVKDFSVVEFEVSVEFDCELEFHFEMPNKQKCKQKTHCSKGGSVVKNKQCGGATSVTVVYPTQTTGTGTTKTACSLGVHSMSFDCSSASTTKVYSTKSKPTSVKTTPATTLATTTSAPVTTSKPAETTSKPAESTSTSAVVVTTSSSVSVPVIKTSSTFVFSNTTSSVVVPSSSAPGTTSSVVVPSSSAPGTTSSAVTSSVPVTKADSSSVPVTSVPGTTASITTTTSVDVVTVIVSTSTTVCPFTSTHVTGGTTSTEVGTTTSTVISTITSTICTKCTASAVTVTSLPGTPVTAPSFTLTTTTPSGPIETAPCPAIVPSCLNTWLFLEGCTSNTDADCYCPSAQFVSNVFECLSAHAADDDEIAQAQTYFQGICAPHIPSNPAIVTGATTALLTTAPPPAATPVPVTTIQILTTLTVPCVETTGISSGSTIPSSSTTSVLSTYITVPQVVFQTVTGTSTISADLVAGTPAPAPAATTPAVQTPVVAPTVSRTGSAGLGATQTPLPFQGAAAQMSFGFSAVFGAVVVAVLAL